MGYFTDKQAIEIWKEKWRGHKKHDMAAKRGENVFRIYEVLEERRNSGSRLVALEQLRMEDPSLAGSIDPSPHVRRKQVVPLKKPNTGQGDLFS